MTKAVLSEQLKLYYKNEVRKYSHKIIILLVKLT